MRTKKRKKKKKKEEEEIREEPISIREIMQRDALALDSDLDPRLRDEEVLIPPRQTLQINGIGEKLSGRSNPNLTFKFFKRQHMFRNKVS